MIILYLFLELKQAGHNSQVQDFTSGGYEQSSSSLRQAAKRSSAQLQFGHSSKQPSTSGTAGIRPGRGSRSCHVRGCGECGRWATALWRSIDGGAACGQRWLEGDGSGGVPCVERNRMVAARARNMARATVTGRMG
jgi:hypothetical protein